MPPQKSGIEVKWVVVRNRTLYIIVAVVLGLGLTGLGFFLWSQMKPKPGVALIEEPSPVYAGANFTELNGSVKVRKAGTYEWIDANQNITLRRNDTVRTVGKSSARVRLFDGTEYLIKPDTIFIIEVMHEDPKTNVRRTAVKLTAGQVNLQTPRQNVAGSRSELATPTAAASFDEMTIAEVGYNESSQVSGFAIFRGGSRLQAGGREVELTSSQMIEVGSDSVFSEIIELPGLPALESPAHLTRLVYADPARETTELSWKEVSDARGYHVMLDRTPNFADPQDYRISGLKVLVPGLPAGTYYWWVSAIDRHDREGGFSNFARFTITRQTEGAQPPALRVSPPTVPVDGLVTVDGTTEPGTIISINDERVTVKPDGAFRHYFSITEAGRHAVVVKANKRSGGTAEITVYATLGPGPK